MASIFFTERLPGISIFQTAGLFATLRAVRKLFDRPSQILATPSDYRQTATPTLFIAGEPGGPERFPKSRVYAKLPEASDFEMLSDD
jgi:hypothetical protein